MIAQFIILFWFIGSSLLITSCVSATPQPIRSQPVARLISSESNAATIEEGKPDQADDDGEPLPGNNSGGKKPRAVNIPKDQVEIADRCEKQLANIPEDQKSNIASFPINHRAIKISYNMKHRIPNWVYYNLSRENLMNSCAKRKDKFRGDPALTSAGIPKDQIINDTGYKSSGFDRGHMAPSGDFIWDQDINEETFFMTNMSPQTAELNQKTWNKLEEHVRGWACGFGELKVYTGPIIESDLKKLNSCVSIPNKFFKVLVGMRNKKLVGIGFVYDQKDGVGDPYKSKAMSIRKVEEMSGLNFFADDYAQKVQDDFETQFDIKDWDGSEEKCYACDGKSKL